MSSQDQYDFYKYSKGKGCKKSGCKNALATGIYQMLMSANSEIKQSSASVVFCTRLLLLVSDVDIRINPGGLLKVSQLPASADSDASSKQHCWHMHWLQGRGCFGEQGLAHGSQEQGKGSRMAACSSVYPYSQKPPKSLQNCPWENGFSHGQIVTAQGGMAAQGRRAG